MIIVTGGGRCGTSLMMQTLQLLGVPLVGDPEARSNHCLWQQEELKLNKKIAVDNTQHQPKGYYELSLKEIGDIVNTKYTNNTKGKAVKLNVDLVTQIPEENIECVFFCRRSSIIDQAYSMQKLANTDLSVDIENSFADNYKDVKLWEWVHHMKTFNKTIESWLESSKLKWKTIWFEDMVTNPEPIIKHLGDFLNLEDPNISEALKNVDKR